jgi:ERCC4-type nuclease
MRLILDERERDLFDACTNVLRMTNSFVKLSKEVLPLGDIYVKTDEDKDVLIIERKTISDLLASIKDGRYEEQSYRLTHSSGFPPHSVLYIIEGTFAPFRTIQERKIVYSALTSLNHFKGFSVMRTMSVQETAEYVVWMCEKIEKNYLKGVFPYYLQSSSLSTDPSANLVVANNYCTVVKKVKKDNITPENISEIILCQIPGISSVTAIAIMKKFSNFPNLMKELQNSPTCLDDIVCETKGKTRKISKACVENVRKFLL